MPMIRHEAIGQDTHGGQFFRFFENINELLVCFFVGKQGGAETGTIDDMVCHSSEAYSFGTAHERIVS